MIADRLRSLIVGASIQVSGGAGGTQVMRFESMPNTLKDKVAIITGGGTGIGEAICHRFAHEGASVLVNGLPGDPVEDVAAAVRTAGGKAIAFAGDVSEEAGAHACVHEAIRRFGRLDVLVND